MINKQYEHILTSEEYASSLVKQVLDVGYIELVDFFDPKITQQLHAFIATRSNCNQKNEQLRGSIAYDIGRSDTMLRVCQKLHDARVRLTGEQRIVLTKEKQVFGLPYKKASDKETNVRTDFHYDGAYINFLMPLVLPENQADGNAGLVMFVNVRKKMQPLLAKVFSRMLRHSLWLRKLYGRVDITYKKNAMYLFFGDLSFHGVEPLTSGERVVMTLNSHW